MYSPTENVLSGTASLSALVQFSSVFPLSNSENVTIEFAKLKQQQQQQQQSVLWHEGSVSGYHLLAFQLNSLLFNWENNTNTSLFLSKVTGLHNKQTSPARTNDWQQQSLHFHYRHLKPLLHTRMLHIGYLPTYFTFQFHCFYRSLGMHGKTSLRGNEKVIIWRLIGKYIYIF